MFALVDVNNFYASCEAVFDASLRGKPLCVLSNNDGCVIARSKEAKALGIKMTEPWHEVRKRHPHILHRSSNYELYADMSARVMSILTAAAPAVEVYSIDESFLDLDGVTDRAGLGRELRARIREWTGLPVCVGIGRTKTRAKIANHIAKKQAEHGGVFDLEALPPASARSMLSALAVEEVWGVGPRLARRLAHLNIHSVQDFMDADSEWIRAHSSVALQRTHDELAGIPCLALELVPPMRQQLVVSRSFGQEIDTYAGVQEAALTYATRAAEKLRAEGLQARYLNLFVHTNGFRADRAQYAGTYTVKLPVATDDTLVFAAAVVFALRRIYREGFKYKKAGIMLSELTPAALRQHALFVDETHLARRSQLNATLDDINQRFGRDSVRLAASGTERPWRMRRQLLSPRYTTRWSDLAVAYAR